MKRAALNIVSRGFISVGVLVLSIVAFLASVPASADVDERMIEISRRMEFDVDEFLGITFIYPEGRTSLGRGASITPYIGMDDNHKWMFLQAHLSRSEWLFFDRLYFVIGDRRLETPQYPTYSDLVSRDVSEYGVRETIHFRWSDDPVEEIGRSVASAPSGERVQVRFAGERGNLDLDIPSDVRQTWADVIYFFDHLEPGNDAQFDRLMGARQDELFVRERARVQSMRDDPVEWAKYALSFRWADDNRLQVEDGQYVASSFSVIVKNTLNEPFEVEGVRLSWEADMGMLRLAEGEPAQRKLDRLDPGEEVRVSWRVVPTDRWADLIERTGSVMAWVRVDIEGEIGQVWADIAVIDAPRRDQ